MTGVTLDIRPVDVNGAVEATVIASVGREQILDATVVLDAPGSRDAFAAAAARAHAEGTGLDAAAERHLAEDLMGQLAAAAADRLREEAGGEVLSNNNINYVTVSDFAGLVSKTLSEKPDVILVGGPSQPTAIIIEEARKQGITVSSDWRAEFDEKMAEQRRRSQRASKMKI